MSSVFSYTILFIYWMTTMYWCYCIFISFNIPFGSWRHKSSSVTTNKVTSGGSWCPSAYSNNITRKISLRFVSSLHKNTNDVLTTVYKRIHILMHELPICKHIYWHTVFIFPWLLLYACIQYLPFYQSTICTSILLDHNWRYKSITYLMYFVGVICL